MKALYTNGVFQTEDGTPFESQEAIHYLIQTAMFTGTMITRGPINLIDGNLYEYSGQIKKVILNPCLAKRDCQEPGDNGWKCLHNCKRQHLVARLLPEKPQNSSHSYSEGSETEKGNIKTATTGAILATLSDHPSINFDDVISCTKCDGSGETQPDIECKRCRGTGIQNIDDLLPVPAAPLVDQKEPDYDKLATDFCSDYHSSDSNQYHLVKKHFKKLWESKVVPVVDHNQQGKEFKKFSLYPDQPPSIATDNTNAIVAVDKESQERREIPVMSSVAEFSLESQEELWEELRMMAMRGKWDAHYYENVSKQLKDKFILTRKPKE